MDIISKLVVRVSPKGLGFEEGCSGQNKEQRIYPAFGYR